MNKQDLINFEKEIINGFKQGNTYGPLHLSGGNEEQLIEIFKQINKEDWIFSTHRSHYHALLKSKDKSWLKREILRGYSSHINSKKHKIFTSAIVGGIIPIALGVALAIKLRNGKEKVWCFVGDMASQMGQFYEAYHYSVFKDLPIKFIIENNEIGCDTPTRKVWGNYCEFEHPKIKRYSYKRVYPHYGIGELVKLNNKGKDLYGGGMW